MADKQLFWIKPRSSVKINGVLYGPDNPKPLPIDKMEKAFLEKHLKAGNIGEKIGTSEMLEANAANEIKSLRTQLEKLQKENAELKAQIPKAKAKEKAGTDG